MIQAAFEMLLTRGAMLWHVNSFKACAHWLLEGHQIKKNSKHLHLLANTNWSERSWQPHQQPGWQDVPAIEGQVMLLLLMMMMMMLQTPLQ